ncbi:hypothetical protein CLOM_g19786 [Closterium sp. NIES-68]|nr:hypothetical protein CLOM_g19786 [Closterium sp. NIES-68]
MTPTLHIRDAALTVVCAAHHPQRPLHARVAPRPPHLLSRPTIPLAAPPPIPRLAPFSSAHGPFFSRRLPINPLCAPPRRARRAAVPVAATTPGGQGSVAVGSFRAGQKRAEVRLPALLLALTSADVLRGGAPGSAEAVDAAVAAGASMVVVGDEGAGGAGMELFEAACAVKALLRGRVPLLVAERADIAAAAGADGVLLSDNGLPAVAARRMMESAASGPLLPLVARRVASVAAAVTATTADGADLIVLAPPAAPATASASEAVRQIRAQQVTIPVVVEGASGAGGGGAEGEQWVSDVMRSGATGVAVTLAALQPAAAAAAAGNGEGDASQAIRAAVGGLVAAMGDGRWGNEGEDGAGGVQVAGAGEAAGRGMGGLEEAREVAREELEQVLTGAGGAPGPAAASAVGGEDVSAQGEAGQEKEEGDGEGAGKGMDGRGLLDLEGRRIMKAERKLLASLLDLLRAACPDMAEIQLLEDSLARLGEPFLVVVVGEFNSGKSSLVNALLGDAFLKVGVVPTTNEITLLRHHDLSPSSLLRARAATAASASAASAAAAGSQQGAEAGRAAARAVVGRVAVEEQRHPDGHMIRFLPADLLKQMNVVDTPGTNVILERQQRLTEEFVPQADLVLFVLSADRPLTESEGGRVVPALHPPVGQEGRLRAQQGGRALLARRRARGAGVCHRQRAQAARRRYCALLPPCLPPRPRRQAAPRRPYPFPPAPSPALAPSSAPAPLDLSAREAAERLRCDPSYQASGFAQLEIFIQQFLEGSSDAGAERLRLKLDTPLGVAAALVAGAAGQLAAQAEAAARDDEALGAVEAQMEGYREAMRSDSLLQRARVAALVREAAGRAEEFVEATLRLGNGDVMLQYLLSPQGAGGGSVGGEEGGSGMLPVSKSFQTQIVGTAVADVRRALVEHHVWLASNNARQLASYRDFARTRWPAVPRPQGGADEESDGEAEGRIPETVGILEGFSPRAAALLLEEEMRESVVGAVTGVGVAGVAAAVLTGVLQSTLEDLLALTVCTTGGSLNVLTFPQRREAVKGKIRQRAAGLIKRLEAGLEGELQAKLGDLEARIRAELAPYRQAVDDELVRVDTLLTQLQSSTQQLEELRQRVRNLAV